MTATSTEIEVVDLTEIVGDIEIPCDYGQYTPYDGGCAPNVGAAKWLLVLADHGHGAETRLACTHCKDMRLLVEDAGVECDKCGHFTFPVRKAYSRIEAL